MGNKKIRLVTNHRDAGKSAGLDAGTDQAWRAEPGSLSGRAQRMVRETEQASAEGLRPERGCGLLDYGMGAEAALGLLCPRPGSSKMPDYKAKAGSLQPTLKLTAL